MIPPFITPGGDPMRQILLLGGTFMAIALAGDTAYALLAGRARVWLSRSRIRSLEIASGCFLMAGGVWMALRGR
jgi:threonine/homoserine/homoserine lactone efflux protein